MQMTKSDLARRLDITKGRVSQLIRRGMPVLPNGLVDLDACTVWISQHVDRHHSGWSSTRKSPAPSAPPPRPPTRQAPVPEHPGPSPALGSDPARVLLVAKAKKALADAKRAERLERKHASDLLERAEVNTYVSDLSTLVRDHVLAQAQRLAVILAPISSERQIYEALLRDGRSMLTSLSKSIQAAGMGDKVVLP